MLAVAMCAAPLRADAPVRIDCRSRWSEALRDVASRHHDRYDRRRGKRRTWDVRRRPGATWRSDTKRRRRRTAAAGRSSTAS